MVARHAVLLLTAILLLVSGSAAAQDGIRSRVEAFYTAWQKQTPDVIWDLLSPEIKVDVDSERYIAEVKKSFEDSKLNSFQIKNIIPLSRTRSIADVIIEISLRSEHRKEALRETTIWVLVEPQKRWYFAGTMPPKQ